MRHSPVATSSNRKAIRHRYSDKIFDAVSAHMAIIGEDGTILETNRAWEDYARRNGMTKTYQTIGENYLAICDGAYGGGREQACQAAQGIRSVISGKTTEFLLEYPCHSPQGKHWFYMRAIRLSDEKPICVIISHEDITPLKLAQEKLKAGREELKHEKLKLQEANIALKVLLKQREEDKHDLEKNVLTNVRQLVLPYIDKLKTIPLKPRQQAVVDILEAGLKDVISPFFARMSNAGMILTPQEMEIAFLVKEGKTSKEMADLLHVAESTIHFHRKNLRAKFGLKNKRTNLRTFLLSMSE